MGKKQRTGLVLCSLLAAAGVLWGASALLQPGHSGLKRMLYGDPKWEQWGGRVVFLGDSITEFCDLGAYYPGLNAVNSGISGDTTSGILERMDSSVYAYEPQVVVLLAGINDLLSGTDEAAVIQNLFAIVAGIHEHLPACRVIVQSVYPVHPWYGAEAAERIRTVDRALQTGAEERQYTYLDLFSVLKAADSDGLDERYSDDGLHPNDAGYRAVQPVLAEALKDVIGEIVYG